MAFYLDSGSPSTRLGTPRQREDDRFEFTKGLSAGIDQTQALGGGLLALAGSAFGNDDLFYAGMDYYNEQMAEASESQADIGRIEDIDGFDDFLSWVSYTAGNALPSLATAVVGGGVGGVAARSAGQAAIRGQAAEFAKKRVTDRAQDSFRKRVADDYAAAALSKRARTGAGIGAFATSAGMGAGESFTRILEEEGEEAPGVALVTGIASGGLDAIAPMRALKRIFPGRQYESVTKGMAEAAQAKTPLYSRALKEMGKQAGVEGITEGMQEIVQNVALEYVESNYSDLAGAFQEALFDESKYSAYVNAAAAGVVGGGVFGGASGVFSKDPVVQQSRVSREDIENENFDGMVADTVDRVRDEPIDQDAQDVDEADDLAARREERQAQAQRNADAETRYGPLFDQIEARRKAQEILTREEEEAPEDVFVPPLSALEGQTVVFQGQTGILTQKEEGFFVVTQDEDIFIESGEFQSAESLGVTPADNAVQYENEDVFGVAFDPVTSRLTLRGEDYTYLRTNSNADGATVSIQAVDKDGNQRTIRNPDVVSRFERLKVEAETVTQPRVIDIDSLSSDIQEEFINEAEQSGVDIPDVVSVEDAVNKAMSLEGYEREVALAKIDNAIISRFSIDSEASEVQIENPSDRGAYLRSAKPSIDRAANKGRKDMLSLIAEGVRSHNQSLQRTYSGTDDTYSAAEIDEDYLFSRNSFQLTLPLTLGTMARGQTKDWSLKSMQFAGRENADKNAKIVSLALLDLASMGMPKGWLDSVYSFSYFTDKSFKSANPDAQAPGGIFTQNTTGENYVGINASLYLRSAEAESSRLRLVLAHEIAHSADSMYNISSRLPGFKADLVDSDGDRFDVEAGEIITELYNLYTSGSDLGTEFSYPFSFAYIQEYSGGSREGFVRFLQREAFAQATMAFLNTPALLKQEAPATYKAMVGLMKDPTTSQLEQGATPNETDIQAVEQRDSRGLRQDIRSPAQPGGDEGGRVQGSREPSTISLEARQASQGLGISQVNNDGNDTGRSVPEVGGPLDFMRVPSTDEAAPVLPMGKVEESLQRLLQETGNNPTAEQLAAIVGSPSPRKGKEDLDRDVKPRTLEELRGFMRQSIAESDGLQWYDQFGRFFRDLVGDANLDEASVVFGVTSAQNSAEQNLADTLHVMSIARRVDPIETPKQFELALRSTPRPGGQRLKITGDQIKRIIQLYRDGSLEGGIKTTTYMQMVADRGRNLFNPFSVQDVHMARVFGFNKKEKDPKSGNEVDAANIGPENSYRYAQYLTSHLADEFNVSPNQAQALLWFYAKSNLSPAKAGKPGTFESAEADSAAEIQVIRDMIQSGEFDTDTALTPALTDGMRPRNKPAQKTTPFSNVAEREELIELARQRSPKVIASAIPGKDRGYGFPDDTSIETLVEYNNAVVEAITDSEGQIPLLRELGIPHEIETGSGSFTGYEPAISIRLIGGTLEQANEIGPVLGDALLQDAVITAQPVFKEEGMPAFLIEKNDGSNFSTEDGMALTDRLNPDKDPGGINFNQPLPNGLVFIDPKVFDDSYDYKDADDSEFYGILQNLLGDGYSISPITQDGAYFDHSEYVGPREAVRGQAGLGGSSDLQDAARGGLYEPVQRVYKEFAERLGVQTQGLTFPSFTDPDVQASDGSFDALPQPPQPTQSAEIEATPEPPPSPDPAPEQPSPTQDLNAQIREENKPIFERVKKTFRRYLSPEGLLPKSIFEEKIKRDSELGAVEIDIRQLLAQYDEAVKTVYSRDLDDAEQKSLQEALTTKFSEIDSLGLDPDIKNAIIGMRRYLDNMSIDYAQILFDEAQALASQGRDEKASAKIDLINTIASNVGSYANRSYKAFDDPKWANNVPDNVLDDARAYLQERGATNVENVLNNILKEGTAFDSMEAFIRESKLGAKDLTILKQRKDIAPQIRALLGEYVDPKINFTKSATKMSRLLFNDRFLKNVKDIGMDTFFFDAETAPPEAYVTFAAESSDVMAPLNGLRTTPEIAQAFQDALGKEQMEDWYRAIVQANGIVKYGKTVIAPTTLARNYLSAYMFTLANGHFNAGKLDQAFASMQSYFKNSGDQVKYLRRLKELGVVYDTPYAGEMMALLDDSKLDVFMDGKVKGAKFFFDNATKLYQYGDDLWKIVGFENEIDILMDAKGITREEAEPLAAKRIRDTYPTYSLVGRGVQKLRRFPLAGTFVSFPAEIIRTSFNMVKYLREDMNDPDMRGTVPRRVAGLAMVSAGVYALQEALMNMMDVDEEEEEAVRILGPKWSENSNLAFIGRDDGKLQYIDMSAFDPYNYFKRPINALLRDQPIDDAMMQSAVEALKPFFGADIAFSNIMEVYKNEKVSGGSVYNESDTAMGQLESITAHLFFGLAPSLASNINRTVKAIDGDRNAAGKVYKLEDEVAALAGFRVSTFDPKISLHFRAFDFNQSKRDATRLLTSTFRDVNDVSDSDLIDAFERSSTARREAFEKMQKIVSAARSSGLNRLQIIQILRSNGVTKGDAQALESGDSAQWNMSDSTLKNSVQKADLLFGDATGQEYERRWQIVQQLLAEENAR